MSKHLNFVEAVGVHFVPEDNRKINKNDNRISHSLPKNQND